MVEETPDPSVNSEDLNYQQKKGLLFQEAVLYSVNSRPLTSLRKCLPIGISVMSAATEAGASAATHFPSTDQHFRDLLLAHVRVYTFAKVHLTGSLTDLALQRLTPSVRIFGYILKTMS